jgi:uncharacterized protein with NRDE domain
LILVCLLVVLSQMHVELPLVVAANRDELFDRPAVPMTVLREEYPRVIGGRDELAGGTWLAVNEVGLVAGLTNRPRPGGRDVTKRSRGELPLALARHASADDAVDDFCRTFNPSDYNAAWLIVADRHAAFSIDMSGDAALVTPLQPGVHILENRPLGAPSPKVDRVRLLLEGVDRISCDDLLDRLRVILADHEIPPGVSAAEEAGVDDAPAYIKAACVHGDRYGTRWSGLVVVPPNSSDLPRVHYVDGPACSAPSVAASSLWC